MYLQFEACYVKCIYVEKSLDSIDFVVLILKLKNACFLKYITLSFRVYYF